MEGIAMRIKIVVEGVGERHATVEVEENCEMDQMEKLLQKVCCGLNKVSAGTQETQKSSYTDTQVRGNNFTPASEGALKALECAARHNGTDVETVCREHRVDPNRISKAQCWQMTHDLNDQSGYVN